MDFTFAPGRTGQLYFLNGDNKRVLVRNLDLDNTEALQRTLSQTRQQYPTQDLKLTIYRLNGSARVAEDTLTIPAAAATFTDLPVTHPTVAFAGAAAPASPQPGMDYFTSYIMNEKDMRLREKDDTIRELRDKIRIQDDTISTQRNKLDEQALNLRFKDREHEIELAGVEANQKKGLAGLGDVLAGLPPELLTVLATKFLGGAPMPAALPTAQLAGLSSGQQKVLDGVLELVREMDDETATKLYVVVQHLSQNPANLEQFIHALTNR